MAADARKRQGTQPLAGWSEQPDRRRRHEGGGHAQKQKINTDITMQKLLFWLLGFLLPFAAQAQSSQEIKKVLGDYILSEKWDSVKILLQGIPQSEYRTILGRIANQNANYADYRYLMERFNISGQTQCEQLQHFIDKNIKKPNTLDIDYVVVNMHLIDILRNESLMDEALKGNEALKNYIDQFKDKTPAEWKRARAYTIPHDIILTLIQGEINKGMEICKELEKVGIESKDTILLLAYKFYYANFLMENGELDAYIENAKAALVMEYQRAHRSNFHGSTIKNLVDALIYKGEFEEAYIESLLDSIYQKEPLISFSFYAKYMGAIPLESEAAQRVYARFGVTNLPALCDTFFRQARDNINLNELFHLVWESSESLYRHKFYDAAIMFKNYCLSARRDLYTKEISENLASHKTLAIEKEKKAEVEREQQKSRFMTIITAIVAGFLLLSLFLALRLNSKSKRLEASNREKELLLREIHHRVKNNFQLVVSFMRLQESLSKQLSLHDFILQTENKLNSMSMVHEMLYKDSNTEQIDLRQYLQELGSYLSQSLGSNNDADVTFELTGDEVRINSDKVISIGLVINEIITNSIKHFKEEELQIHAKIKQLGNNFELVVGDNGKGFPTDFNPESSQSLGTKVVLLLMRQLSAQATWRNNNGAEWAFVIPC